MLKSRLFSHIIHLKQFAPLSRVYYSSKPLSMEYIYDKCFGCGAEFHEHDSNLAGYLPNMKDRIDAHKLGISYEQYVRDILEQDKKDPVFAKYLAKKQRERVGLPVETLKIDNYQLEADNLIAFKKDLNSDKIKNDGELSVEKVDNNPKLVCARCHSLQYHSYPHDKDSDSVNRELARKNSVEAKIINSIGGVVIILADILDFPGSLNAELISNLGIRPVIVAVNKADLIPNETEQLRNYIDKHIRQDKRLKNVVKVHLISMKEDMGLDKVLGSIIRFKNPLDDIYVVGHTNVGKSTFLNKLLQKLERPGNLTESWIPGTTIDCIRIPIKKIPKLRQFVLDSRHRLIKEKQMDMFQNLSSGGRSISKIPSSTSSGVSKFLQGSLIDTPGIDIPKITSFLTANELNVVTPRRPLKPISYFIEPGQSFWMGGLGRIDYVEGKAQVILTTMFDPRIPIHTSNILKAEWLWKVHGGGRSKAWKDSIFLPKASENVQKLRVVRKNVNKDLYAGIKFTPPFFSDPKEFLKSYSELKGGEGEPSGILHERVKAYPDWKLAFTHMFTRKVPLSNHGHSSLHFRESLGDFVFPGIGWISVAGNFSVADDRSALFNVYTPGGVGSYIRTPSLVPSLVAKRGKKIRGHPDGLYK